MNRGHGPNESTTNLGGARKFTHPTPTPQLPWTTFKHNLVQGIHIPSRWVKFYEAY
jgi:hypothetical protein